MELALGLYADKNRTREREKVLSVITIREMRTRTAVRSTPASRVAGRKGHGNRAVRLWRKWNPQKLPGGMQTGAATSETGLAVSQTFNHRVSI